MAYFKINGTDYSDCVSSLKIDSAANYTAQTNAAGNTVVDYINTKRTINVGIIPLDGNKMAALKTAIDGFLVQITFRNPKTQALETIGCIIPSDNIDYYTIQADKVMYKAFTLKFIEL